MFVFRFDTSYDFLWFPRISYDFVWFHMISIIVCILILFSFYFCFTRPRISYDFVWVQWFHMISIKYIKMLLCFYIGFITVSRKLIWEVVDGFQCSKIVNFISIFYGFRILLILYKFCKCFVAGSGRWPGGHPGGHRAMTRFERYTSTALYQTE